MNARCYRLELRLSMQLQSKYRNFHSIISAVEIMLSPVNPENSPTPMTSASLDVSRSLLPTTLFRIQGSNDHNYHSIPRERRNSENPFRSKGGPPLIPRQFISF
ncbi:hypothetical protein AVEN_62634-1 [Araneus ventricosus]|uniref:Uncharacterized protein n=1 Tax=Araneus ventricosus TaxID=182803 RepID=A0A4Y2H6R6_ARAVE|nr:hypothetical protein AVEN_62634-1 [Araneus ventricosus]